VNVTSTELPGIAAERTDLSSGEVEHLQLLLSDWTMIADLAFADLILWLPTFNEAGFVAAGQIRPSTARTHIPKDVTGNFVPRGRHIELDRAFLTGEIWTGEPGQQHEITQAIPISFLGRTIAVLGRYSSPAEFGRMEAIYDRIAQIIFEMLSIGAFPRVTHNDQGTGGRGGAPRVGDGLLLLDKDGTIEFASPNAISAFRRLGVAIDVEGQVLADLVAQLNRHGVPINDTLSLVARGRIQATAEIAGEQSSATLRSIPLVSGENTSGNLAGAGTLVLMRDVTDLRRREQALLGKDAAIREIHHRVKNNLQTVASLLRLQSRRLTDVSAQIELAEAGRRISTIAIVHDMLAHNPGDSVDFDEVVGRVIPLSVETASLHAVNTTFTGEFGVLHSDTATTLALVLAELVANAVEHATAGRDHVNIAIEAQRLAGEIEVSVSDDGPGVNLPLGSAGGLGLAIVTTLVAEELGGSIEFTHVNETAEFRGTKVTVRLPLHS
jgi:two-component system, sensor histidine kinase PdtaS